MYRINLFYLIDYGIVACLVGVYILCRVYPGWRGPSLENVQPVRSTTAMHASSRTRHLARGATPGERLLASGPDRACARRDDRAL